MGLVAAGLLGGCAPVRIALRCYPEDFSRIPGRADPEVEAFVDTVVPGAGASTDAGRRVLEDTRFPLHRVRPWLASDLCARARASFSAESFHALDAGRRAAVVRHGLRDAGVRGRIYRGAVYLVQVAVYAGIYDDRGCALIDFPGGGELVSAEDQTYPLPERFLASPMSLDGNPN